MKGDKQHSRKHNTEPWRPDGYNGCWTFGNSILPQHADWC